jgi:hypothetical protein
VLSPLLGRMAGFIELKTTRGRMSQDQKAIGNLMLERRVPYAVTNGRDEPIRILEVWGALPVSNVNVGCARSADPPRDPAGAEEDRARLDV